MEKINICFLKENNQIFKNDKLDPFHMQVAFSAVPSPLFLVF